MYTILLFTEDDDVRQRVAPPFPYCSLMYTILLFTEDDDVRQRVASPFPTVH